MFQCQSIVSTEVTWQPLTLQLIDKGGQWPFFWKVQKHFCLQTWKVTISNFECVGTILSKKVKIKGTLLSFSCSLVHTHTHPCSFSHSGKEICCWDDKINESTFVGEKVFVSFSANQIIGRHMMEKNSWRYFYVICRCCNDTKKTKEQKLWVDHNLACWSQKSYIFLTSLHSVVAGYKLTVEL